MRQHPLTGLPTFKRWAVQRGSAASATLFYTHWGAVRWANHVSASLGYPYQVYRLRKAHMRRRDDYPGRKARHRAAILAGSLWAAVGACVGFMIGVIL